MFKLKKEIVIPSAVCVCIGFLSCSILIGSYVYMHKSETENISKLTALLEKSDENNKKLLEELETKNKSISDYQAAVSDNSQTLKVMQEELEKAKKLASTTELKGKGITVTITDSKKNAGGIDSNALVIHDEDLLLFVNELNSAGAEAIEINGQRISSRSSIKCAGSIININGVRVSSPFVIKAIGDPEVMASALLFKGGVVDNLKPWGFSVDITEEENLTISAYNQGNVYKYAS